MLGVADRGDLDRVALDVGVVGQDREHRGVGVLVEREGVVVGHGHVVDPVDGHAHGGGRAAVELVGELVAAGVVGVGGVRHDALVQDDGAVLGLA
ncbi:hypothetical protein C7S10_08775, partial [Nocardioides currus]